MSTQASHRYDRQAILPEIGEAGQARIREASVLIVGCGALGCAAADLLARAGIGRIRLVDRDIVELSNLQRQTLFCESDAESATPKAVAAAHRLNAINSDVAIDPVCDDFRASNAKSLAENCDLLIDGLDNFDGRYILNDLSVSSGIPYLYAGVIGTVGMTMTVLPRCTKPSGLVQWQDADATACLRCIFPEPPNTGVMPTCDTAGVLGPAVATVSGWQASAALALLCGNSPEKPTGLHTMDLWRGTHQRINTGPPTDECPCCIQRQFSWLSGERGSATETICGQEVVQIFPQRDAVPLTTLRQRLSELGHICGDQHALRFIPNADDVSMTIFADGRALIGVGEPAAARSLYDRYIGT